MHWDVPGGNNASAVYINGQLIANFTSRSSIGSNKLTFDDLNPSGISGMDGCVALFLLYKNRTMTD